jgi:hypothetical protein
MIQNGVIVHPKFRGIGLGEFLVKQTLSLSNAKVVEVLAVMAKYNPFFDREARLVQRRYCSAAKEREYCSQGSPRSKDATKSQLRMAG